MESFRKVIRHVYFLCVAACTQKRAREREKESERGEFVVFMKETFSLSLSLVLAALHGYRPDEMKLRNLLLK
jgi:hypothetical protein